MRSGGSALTLTVPRMAERSLLTSPSLRRSFRTAVTVANASGPLIASPCVHAPRGSRRASAAARDDGWRRAGGRSAAVARTSMRPMLMRISGAGCSRASAGRSRSRLGTHAANLRQFRASRRLDRRDDAGTRLARRDAHRRNARRGCLRGWRRPRRGTRAGAAADASCAVRRRGRWTTPMQRLARVASRDRPYPLDAGGVLRISVVTMAGESSRLARRRRWRQAASVPRRERRGEMRPARASRCPRRRRVRATSCGERFVGRRQSWLHGRLRAPRTPDEIGQEIAHDAAQAGAASSR